MTKGGEGQAKSDFCDKGEGAYMFHLTESLKKVLKKVIELQKKVLIKVMKLKKYKKQEPKWH